MTGEDYNSDGNATFRVDIGLIGSVKMDGDDADRIQCHDSRAY